MTSFIINIPRQILLGLSDQKVMRLSCHVARMREIEKRMKFWQRKT
jgi:hypothetical protein